MITVEPSAAVERPFPARRPALFAALRFRDFRFLWIGLLISNFGTWMQFTAIGYFIASLAPDMRTGSLYLGLLGASRAIPVLALSPLAGVAADRLPRRRVLLVTNLLLSAQALGLALLTQLHAGGIAAVLALSAAGAAVSSFDAPARQSMVPLLVDRHHVGNAIGLNSIAFNAPAIIGPAVAGFVIVAVGIAGSFYTNAAATLAVVLAVLAMRETPVGTTLREPVLGSIAGGLRFLFGHPVLRWVVLMLVVTALLLRPFQSLLPALALHELHTDARGLGWLLAASGLGGFFGAAVTAYFGSSARRGRLWLWAGALMGLAIAALGASHRFGLTAAVLVLTGIAMLAFIGISNILIQTLSPDDVRGRAISVYSMILLGLVPAGTFVIGALGSLMGLAHVFELAGALGCALVIWLALTRPALRSA